MSGCSISREWLISQGRDEGGTFQSLSLWPLRVDQSLIVPSPLGDFHCIVLLLQRFPLSAG